MADLMTDLAFIDVLGRLNNAIRSAGGESAFARAHGLIRQEVHEAMKGNRHPSPGLLAAVGVRKVVTVRYEAVPPPLVTAAVPEPGACACPAAAGRPCLNPVCPRQPDHPHHAAKRRAA